MKPITVFILFAFTTLSSYAQVNNVPSGLRVDLLPNADFVYEQGQRKELTLKQALAGNGKWQYCSINSRYPVFSWEVGDDYQTAFQVMVAGSRELLSMDSADIWNPGWKKSNDNLGVLYQGPALRPASVYYWKVRIKGVNGKTGAYSAIHSFCTGGVLRDFSLPSFVHEKTEQTPVQISKNRSGSSLYDFGRDGFGQLKLSVNALHTNDTLVLHLGEALDKDGHVNTRPAGSVRYRMLKVPLARGRHQYQPVILPDKRNTGENAILMPAAVGEVLPFRYAEVVDKGERYTVDTLSRYLVTSPFDNDAAFFTSSDSALNMLWELCKYTIKATSFTGYYVDGDRERIPYEADALINQLSHYACDASFLMARRTLDYLIYHPTWPTEWSLQNILITWYDYLHSGDLRLAKKIYPELKAKLLSSLARPDGLISTRTGKQTPEFLAAIHYKSFNSSSQLKDIVDWPPPGGVGGGQSGVMGETDGFVFTDYNAVVNAWYYVALKSMVKLSAALGYKQDVIHYQREAQKVQTAYGRAFFNRQTDLVADGEGTEHSSLHANFFALAFGLVPKEMEPKVVSFIRSRGMACSVYGAQFLLDGLYTANEAGYAQALLTSTDKRSWFNMLREGATMTMEAWGQAYKPNQDWNHAWGTAPANVIVRHLAGIQPLTPGYGKVQIKPQPGMLEKLSLKCPTIRGSITVSFENKADGFSMQIQLPGNCTGQVYLPFASAGARVSMDGQRVNARYVNGYYQIQHVTPGKHSFEVR